MSLVKVPEFDILTVKEIESELAAEEKKLRKEKISLPSITKKRFGFYAPIQMVKQIGKILANISLHLPYRRKDSAMVKEQIVKRGFHLASPLSVIKAISKPLHALRLPGLKRPHREIETKPTKHPGITFTSLPVFKILKKKTSTKPGKPAEQKPSLFERLSQNFPKREKTFL